MPFNDYEDTRTYKVVVNDEQQYSIWLGYRELPKGWTEVGKAGTKSECLEYIKEVWTDLTPLSVRMQLAELKKQELSAPLATTE